MLIFDSRSVGNKLLEIDLLKQNVAKIHSSAANSSTSLSLSSSEIQEQVDYIDKKLQNVLNHIYEVRSECEQSVIFLSSCLYAANSN